MGEHGPRVDHIIIAALDIDAAADHIFKVCRLSTSTANRFQELCQSCFGLEKFGPEVLYERGFKHLSNPATF